MLLTVSDIVEHTDIIRSVVLRSRAGEVLPPFTPGSHLPVYIASGDDRRSYSLIDFSGTAGQTSEQVEYRIAVRLEVEGAGGSRFVHSLRIGDEVRSEQPRNRFPIAPGVSAPILIAGGIGITPIISMASHMRAQGRSFALHYSGRSRAGLAFLSELGQIAGADLQVYADDEPNRRLDVTELLAVESVERPVYVCGPTGLIDTVIAEARRLGRSDENIHFEHFTAAAPQSSDECFEIELGQSGRRFSIPPDRTILDVLIEAGVDVIYDCKRGDCGICQVGVLHGEPDHRDYILSETERAAGKFMQICISRSKSTVLVLDL